MLVSSFKFDMSSFELRNANETDSDFVLALRNTRDAVNFSPSRTEIDAKDHQHWFSSVLDSSSRLLLIGEDISLNPRDSLRVGMVRFDKSPQTSWIVSIAVVNKYRGMGLGGWLLNQGLVRLTEAYGQEPRTVTASVHEENTPSRRLFFAEGFKEIGHQGNYIHLIKHLGANHLG